MNNIENLGFDNWFKDKVDLSKSTDFKIARVIRINKNTQRLGRAIGCKETINNGGSYV